MQGEGRMQEQYQKIRCPICDRILIKRVFGVLVGHERDYEQEYDKGYNIRMRLLCCPGGGYCE